MQDASLRCGPAGWSYPHWNGVVFPSPRPRGFHALEFMAEYFDVAEINTSFHAPLRPEVSRLWAGKVKQNPRFLFTAKLGRRFSHERSLDKAEVAAFQQGLEPLAAAGKLGCLLMQFPWSFRFTPENREFLIKLRRTFHPYPLVAEMRHASWMMDEALGVLIDYRIGFCNIDQPEYTKAMPPTAFLTSPIGYVRLHGRNCFHWFREYGTATQDSHRYDYLYSNAELEQWKQRIERVSRYSASTFVVLNNDGGGKAVVNALQMQSMLRGTLQAAPAGLLRQYRLELAGFCRRVSSQDCLFKEYQAVA